jgi:pyruvate/2-oxoglutarate dehydrogenase complex dihydrolipoamide acyltransferase (E2) component
MPVTVRMPALSPTMTEGKIAQWLKKEGDAVKSGDLLAEIETDKATMEVEATDEGTLGKILADAGGDTIAVNAPIAVIIEDGEDSSALDEAVKAAQDEAKSAPKPEAKPEEEAEAKAPPAPAKAETPAKAEAPKPAPAPKPAATRAPGGRNIAAPQGARLRPAASSPGSARASRRPPRGSNRIPPCAG